MIDHEFYCGTENVMNVSPVVVHSMKLGVVLKFQWSL